ncbi:endonuclease [Candidatus Poribacteria bacterium]|nr:endonuclease [Candidatus Poribacteria bacterium]
MKPDDFVIATQPINGIVKNSVGIINSICEKGAQVYFIGKNEVVIAPFGSLRVINIGETGEEYAVKICNVCHILKPKNEFDRNQTNAKGRPTTRPSCKDCRKIIDGEKMPTSERRRMDDRRPSDQSVFICPICEKRTIVKVTAKIVADHDHSTGSGREWICDSCNTGLGRFKDNIAILETAIEYLKRFEDDESENSESG